MTTLTTTMPGRMRAATDEPGAVPQLVTVMASYDPSSPLSITFEFTPSNPDNSTETWVVSRDLVALGLAANMWVGHGDVQFGSQAAFFTIRLLPHHEDRTTHIVVPRERIVWLVTESLMMSHSGSPEEYAALEREIDADLAGLFGEEAA